ncbi:hypothetical protein GGR57DRAFT_266756 [Xylariaceae sp. FL1272]|nr:hypothetical protein GGR57DRAFT_266756 [Xylariaceae sp. FL1272]
MVWHPALFGGSLLAVWPLLGSAGWWCLMVRGRNRGDGKEDDVDDGLGRSCQLLLKGTAAAGMSVCLYDHSSQQRYASKAPIKNASTHHCLTTLVSACQI